MPRQKDLKRLVRSRMQKTGESYTTARSHLVDKPGSTTSVTPAPFTAHVVSATRPHADVAGMSDATIREKTGHTWEEWIGIIDEAGGRAMSHSDRASLVNEIHGVDGWWSQCVTVGYERIVGMRARGQRMDGSWEASKSRTFAVPVEALFKAWSDGKVRKRWLDDPGAKVRTATPYRSLRLQLSDGSIVGVWFTAKGEKSVAGVQHTKLPDKESAERMKGFWADNLAALAETLGGRGAERAAKKAVVPRATASSRTRARAPKPAAGKRATKKK